MICNIVYFENFYNMYYVHVFLTLKVLIHVYVY